MIGKRTSFGIALAVAVLLLPAPAKANHLQVNRVRMSNQDVSGKTMDVVFDLSWENSWRSDYPACTNWDAAWVFVKFRPQGSNDWAHAKLSASAADHAAPGGVIAVGSDGANGVGVFVYSASVRTGEVSYAGTRLKWNYGANGYSFAKGDVIELSVQAIEMVYVPEGSFKVGSGGTENGSFTDGSRISGASIPFEITGSWDRQFTNVAGKLWGVAANDIVNHVIGIGGYGSVVADFPSGYHAFYCMKYEITAGQYRDFLSLLNRAQQDARTRTRTLDYFVLSTSPALAYRNILRCPSVVPASPAIVAYGCDGNANKIFDETNDAMDRACNGLSWADGAAYSDWAGLRPMTELEFEKACRGPATPLANEYAWGTATYVAQTATTNDVDGSGTEKAFPVNANFIGSAGPMRVGIYATNHATRVAAGASYWGIMELSGNLSEQVVWVQKAGGRAFTGAHGDGSLTAAGVANVAAWPTATSDGAGFRGWTYNAAYPLVSCRDFPPNTADGGYNYVGWRGVRSAP